MIGIGYHGYERKLIAIGKIPDDHACLRYWITIPIENELLTVRAKPNEIRIIRHNCARGNHLAGLNIDDLGRSFISNTIQRQLTTVRRPELYVARYRCLPKLLSISRRPYTFNYMIRIPLCVERRN